MRLRSIVTVPLRAAMLLGTLTVVLAGGAGGLFLWRRSGPERTDADREHDRAALRAACDAAATKVAELRGHPARVGVLKVGNDPHGDGESALLAAFKAQPDWDAQAEDVLRSLASDLAAAVANSGSLEELLSANERLGLQVVAAGRILELVTARDGSHRAVVNLQAFDVEQKTWLVRDNFSGSVTPDTHLFGRVPAWGRVLIWVALVVLLPWVSAPATFWAMEQKRNSSSLLLVGAYVLFDVLAAWALLGFVRDSGTAWRLGLALVLSAAYTYVACEAVAARAAR